LSASREGAGTRADNDGLTGLSDRRLAPRKGLRDVPHPGPSRPVACTRDPFAMPSPPCLIQLVVSPRHHARGGPRDQWRAAGRHRRGGGGVRRRRGPFRDQRIRFRDPTM